MMSKVTSHLMGGLGNYMFQIAAAYAYGMRYGKECFFDEKSALKVHGGIDSYKRNIFSKVKIKEVKKLDYSILRGDGFHYTPIPFRKENVLLMGYFQSEKYFKEYSKEIRDLFRFYPKELKMEVEGSECSIHVRRGDYLKLSDHHPTQSIDYYTKAIKNFKEGTKFLVFSDDIEWCKNNINTPGYDFTFVEGNNDYIDLYMMSKCKDNIIANSSFSWWGAWMNENPDKKVIAPKKWFGPKYSNWITDDIYCDKWIKI